MDKPKEVDHNDGAYKSRKFVLTLLGLILLTGVSLCALKFPPVVAVLPTFTGGIIGVLSLYFTGNVMAKHVNGSTQAKLIRANNGNNDEENGDN